MTHGTPIVAPLRRLAFALLALWAPPTRAEIIQLAAADGRPVLTYEAAASPNKPYVAQLYTPGGVAVLRDAPADHLHHHALMFAVSVAGVSFWEEKAAGGRQVPLTLRQMPDRIEQTLAWTTPEGRIVLREERLVQAWPGRTATLLSWRSRLRPPADAASAVLTGSHYYGLGARFVTDMDRGGEFSFGAATAGEVVRGTERLTSAPWGAYAAVVAGKPVTFAIFSHPGNVRHPPRLFTMTAPFAYLAATLNLWKEPYSLSAARPLELRYGVALWDGRQDAAAIEAMYRTWVKLAE